MRIVPYLDNLPPSLCSTLHYRRDSTRILKHGQRICHQRTERQHQQVLRKISVNVFDEATNVSTTRSTWLNPGCPDCASTPQRRS